MKRDRKNKCQYNNTCNLLPLDNGRCIKHQGLIKTKKEKNNHNPYGFKSEIEMREYIWETRVHKCFVSNEDLEEYAGTDFYPNLFAHILPKGKYPEFKLYINCVALTSPTVHNLFDNGSLKQLIAFEKETGCSFAPLFELEEILFNEYTKKISKKRYTRKIIGLYQNYKKNEKI